MREILFKAKRLDNSEWVEGNLIACPEADEGYKTLIIPCFDSNMYTNGCDSDIGFETWYKIDPETLCQYTGLTDKNGKKIWENDVLKLKFREGRIGSVEREYNYAVKYDTVEASWELEGNLDLLGHPRFTQEGQHTFEVIGNIFDNPELLKGEPL